MNETNTDNYILIMAGGVGSRFWPSSRESKPKQFLDILNCGKSLLQMTFERCARIVPESNIYIATHKKYSGLTMAQLPSIGKDQLLLEPSRNNTAPCVAYAALKIRQLNPKANMAVMPSDHVIRKEDLFIDKINLAFQKAAGQNILVTLGIIPSRPDTGYGYIECPDRISKEKDQNHSLIPVLRFVEKPDFPTAKEYVESGKYLWNAGIFIWNVGSILQSFEKHAQDILDTLSRDVTKINTEEEMKYMEDVYPQTQSISIDYAILEKSDNIVTIPADIGWNDLGTWVSLYEYLKKEEKANVTLTDSSIIQNTRKCIIKAKKDKLVVIKDLDDYIVIDEDDVLLIYPKSDEQGIKELRQSIEDKKYI